MKRFIGILMVLAIGLILGGSKVMAGGNNYEPDFYTLPLKERLKEGIRSGDFVPLIGGSRSMLKRNFEGLPEENQNLLVSNVDRAAATMVKIVVERIWDYRNNKPTKDINGVKLSGNSKEAAPFFASQSILHTQNLVKVFRARGITYVVTMYAGKTFKQSSSFFPIHRSGKRIRNTSIKSDGLVLTMHIRAYKGRFSEKRGGELTENGPEYIFVFIPSSDEIAEQSSVSEAQEFAINEGVILCAE